MGFRGPLIGYSLVRGLLVGGLMVGGLSVRSIRDDGLSKKTADSWYFFVFVYP